MFVGPLPKLERAPAHQSSPPQYDHGQWRYARNPAEDDVIDVRLGTAQFASNVDRGQDLVRPIRVVLVGPGHINRFAHLPQQVTVIASSQSKGRWKKSSDTRRLI
ncbi:hypothetical protein, partial [Bradyrhizobium sp. NBAIM08]|uniref:hypothetical protein n=1 Tax=Bradyrhizobium sp. NBAIM08 TaxID=2793815 RepID=UPI001CD25F36